MEASSKSMSEVVRKDLTEIRRFIISQFRCREHDDGSLAPLMIRFAWHSCGTYDCSTNAGGSNGGTIIHDGERSDPENAGFEKAHAILKNVKDLFGSLLSTADVIVLCGYVAIEAMGGPHVPFCHGRLDFTPDERLSRYGSVGGGCPFGDGQFNPCGSRLPSADIGKHEEYAEPRLREKPTIDAVRGTFQRMGFDDKETVCLIVLGHQFGRCHPNVSGYEHPWYTFDPTHWNVYETGLGFLSAFLMAGYKEVLSSTGKRQFVMEFGGGEPFRMLISDMVLLWDHSYKEHLMWYDKHRREFREDAAAVWKKLTELGCGEGLLTPEC